MSDDNVAVQITADVSGLVSNVNSAADSVDQSMNQILESLTASINKLNANLSEGMEQVKTKMHEVEQEGVNVGESVEKIGAKLHEALEIGGVLALAEGFEKLSEAIEHTFQQTAEVTNMSEVMRVTADEFMALSQASKETEVGMNIVERTAIRLGTTLDNARNHSGEAQVKLMELGITAAQIADPLFDVNKALDVVGDRLRDTATAEEEVSAINKEFGSRAALVSRVLKEYHGDAESVARVNKELGSTTEKDREAIEAFHKDVATATTRLDNLRNSAVAWIATKLNPDVDDEAASISKRVAADEVADNAAATSAQRQKEAAESVSIAEINAVEKSLKAFKEGDAAKVVVAKQFAEMSEKFYLPDSDKTQAAWAEYAAAVKANQEKVNRDLDKAYKEDETHNQKLLEDKIKSTRAAYSEMSKEAEKYFEEQTKDEQENAKAVDKAANAQLDAAKSIIEAQNEQKSISPSTYQAAMIALATERRDAEIQMYTDIANASKLSNDLQVSQGEVSAKTLEQVAENNAQLQIRLAHEVADARAKADQQIEQAEIKTAKEVQQNWQQVTNTMTSTFMTGFNSMLKGTENFHQAAKKAFDTLALDVIDNVVSSMVRSWLAGEATKLAASQSAAGILKILHLENLTTAKTTQTAEATGQITSDAAVAAAGAFAATAAIPYVGPFLAPAAAAEAETSVLSFLSMAAFEKGGIVSQDQMAMVHKDEMVLPKQISQGIQERIIDGGSSGDGSSMARNNFHITAHDASSFDKYLNSQSSRNSLMKAVSKAMMRGNRSLPSGNGNRSML